MMETTGKEEEAVDGLVAYSWDFHQDGECLRPV